MRETTFPWLILTFGQILSIVMRRSCSISSPTASMFAGVTLVSRVTDATCFERIDVHWKTSRKHSGFSIMFHPQTVVAIYAKFQWVLCPQRLKLNDYNLCVERRCYCLAHCIIDRRNDKQSVTWRGVNVFKTRLFELPRRPIWISDIVQVCIL